MSGDLKSVWRRTQETSPLKGTPKKSQRKPYEVMKPGALEASTRSMEPSKVSRNFKTAVLRDSGLKVILVIDLMERQ